MQFPPPPELGWGFPAGKPKAEPTAIFVKALLPLLTWKLQNGRSFYRVPIMHYCRYVNTRYHSLVNGDAVFFCRLFAGGWLDYPTNHKRRFLDNYSWPLPLVNGVSDVQTVLFRLTSAETNTTLAFSAAVTHRFGVPPPGRSLRGFQGPGETS